MTGVDSARADADEFRRLYADGLHTYLRDLDDAALHGAYELGRRAVERDLTVLELAAFHHEQLVIAVRAAGDGADVERVTSDAGHFFLESLSTFEMVRRGFRETSEIARLERRHAAMLRQLSSFLADASLALSESESVNEVLTLVAEQARELLGADCAIVDMHPATDGDEPITAASYAHPDWNDDADRGRISAPITTLDGREFGSIELACSIDGEFTDIDQAVLAQLAQMASAALERAHLYRQASDRSR